MRAEDGKVYCRIHDTKPKVCIGFTPWNEGIRDYALNCPACRYYFTIKKDRPFLKFLILRREFKTWRDGAVPVFLTAPASDRDDERFTCSEFSSGMSPALQRSFIHLRISPGYRWRIFRKIAPFKKKLPVDMNHFCRRKPVKIRR